LAMPIRRLKAGQVAEATLSFKRCPETMIIQVEDLLDYRVTIRGGDHAYCRWDVVEQTNNFSGLHGGYVKYRFKCIADCPEPAKKVAIYFVVSLLQKGSRLYSAARGAEIELAPCGPFALTFTSPNQARRSP